MQEVIQKLPASCKYEVKSDRTSDLYLEVSEEYEEYIEKHLYKPYREQN